MNIKIPKKDTYKLIPYYNQKLDKAQCCNFTLIPTKMTRI